MPQPSAPSDAPGEPTPNRVPSGGVSGRAAAVVALGTLAVIVALALAGQGVDEPHESEAAIHGSASQPTPVPTPVEADAAFPRPPCKEIAPTGGTPLPDEAGARPGDNGDRPLPLGAVEGIPNADRLDFLYTTPDCFRDAHWIDPHNPGRGSGPWTTGRPFHVREGFINNDAEPLGDGFDVVLYVTRLDGVGNEATFRYESDYVLRGTTDRCGPTYMVDAGPRTCEWFVHDFPNGLPEGRFAIWAVWQAPCTAWVGLGLTDACGDPDEVISLFASGFDSPFSPEAPVYDEAPAF